jgi:two-component system, cell cycle response regulator CtrA
MACPGRSQLAVNTTPTKALGLTAKTLLARTTKCSNRPLVCPKLPVIVDVALHLCFSGQSESATDEPAPNLDSINLTSLPSQAHVLRNPPGMRVLLIEDDSATAQSIELMLKSEGFNVYITNLGEEGVDLGKLYDYDIILLDLNLPDMPGFEVLRSLRVSKVKTPILILSGIAGIEDKVNGLGSGADDYMTKPFHKDELVARIHAIVRRSKGHAESIVDVGDLRVNLEDKTVDIDGARVHLTGKEYQLLELLALRKGMTLTKETFLNHLYGGMDEPEIKIIDVFVCKLRRKLANASGGKDYIETVWGRGYVLREPNEDEAKVSA